MFKHGDTLIPSGGWIQLLATVVQQFPRHISPARVKYLNGQNPSEVGRLLAQIFVPMFVSPGEQLELVKKRNAERNWGFTEEDFAALGEPPAWPDGDFCAVVLEVSLDTVQQTFEEAWLWTSEVQPDRWRWEKLLSDENSLRLLSGIGHQRGLRWRLMDLAANWENKDGIAPQDVRDAKKSPHCAILWAAALFPAWVQAMDGTNVPYACIPGYEAYVSGDQPWTSVPDLSFFRGFRRVMLFAHVCGYRGGGWAVPEFRE